jgi:hypothetical protein
MVGRRFDRMSVHVRPVVGRVAVRQFFCPSTSVCLRQYHLTNGHQATNLYRNVAITSRSSGPSVRTFQTHGNVGALDMKILSLFDVSGGLKAIELRLAYKNRRRIAPHAALCRFLHHALGFEQCTFHFYRGRSRSLQVCRTF